MIGGGDLTLRLVVLIALLVVQAPNFSSLALVSFAAAVCSVTYSTIGIGGSIKAALNRAPDIHYNLDGLSMADGIFGAFNALGVVAFACEIQHPGVSLESQAPAWHFTVVPVQ